MDIPVDPEGGTTAERNRRRIKERERDLHCEDKAASETAALRVLSKKLSAIFDEAQAAGRPPGTGLRSGGRPDAAPHGPRMC